MPTCMVIHAKFWPNQRTYSTPTPIAQLLLDGGLTDGDEVIIDDEPFTVVRGLLVGECRTLKPLSRTSKNKLEILRPIERRQCQEFLETEQQCEAAWRQRCSSS